jgi:hypothetical protein
MVRHSAPPLIGQYDGVEFTFPDIRQASTGLKKHSRDQPTSGAAPKRPCTRREAVEDALRRLVQGEAGVVMTGTGGDSHRIPDQIIQHSFLNPEFGALDLAAAFLTGRKFGTNAECGIVGTSQDTKGVLPRVPDQYKVPSLTSRFGNF